MDDEACMYSKYGFCKFKDHCNRQHYKEQCEDVAGCKGVKVCPKIHPKSCKRYQTNKGCQYGSECAYRHEAKTVTQNHQTKELDKKVKVLETLVIEMCKKMVKLETELQDIKIALSKIETKKVIFNRRIQSSSASTLLGLTGFLSSEEKSTVLTSSCSHFYLQ